MHKHSFFCGIQITISHTKKNAVPKAQRFLIYISVGLFRVLKQFL